MGVTNSSSAAGRRKGLNGQGEIVRYLCEIADFVRRLRIHRRFGELSRAPLRLLRFELCGDIAQCEWMARPPDLWDMGLPPTVGERHASKQALQDALSIRDLLFYALPDLHSVEIRVYREAANETPALIIAGRLTPEASAPRAVRSVAMRAKLLGLRFGLSEGILENLQQKDQVVNSRPQTD